MEKLREPIGKHSFQIQQMHNKINDLITDSEKKDRGIEKLRQAIEMLIQILPSQLDQELPTDNQYMKINTILSEE